MKPAYLALGVALGVIIILVVIFRDGPSGPAEVEEAEPVRPPAEGVELEEPDAEVPLTPAIQPVVEPAPEPAEPPYVADDPTLRAELAELSPPSSWLELDELRQRFATLLVSLADGFVPRKLLGPIQPAAAPSAVAVSGRPSDQRYELVANGAERFGPVVDVALRLPPEAAAALLERLEPAISAELVELGDRRDLDDLLGAIITQLEAVPDLKEPMTVRRPGLRYEFVDPALESLNDLKKTGLRMGPELRQRVIDYGRAVIAERAKAKAQRDAE